MQRLDHETQIMYWKLHSKMDTSNLERKDGWHGHEPETVLKNYEAKSLWYMWQKKIQHDPVVEARPDIVVIEKKRKVCKIVGITVPHDYQIAD